MKTSVARRVRSRHTRLCGAAPGVLLLLTGCVATHPYLPLPAPELILLSAAAPAIPPGCAPAPGVIYRTSFDVQTDGTVARTTPANGHGCVQLALQQWVSTFRYQPPSRQIPSVIDWMQVTAARGD